MSVNKNLLAALLLVLSALPALPQRPASPYPYLLRIQRQNSDLDTCVLVQRNGDYHMERVHGDIADVYEGSLSGDELAHLHSWIDEDSLQKLRQEQIPVPLIVSSVELVQINIFRRDHWQDLVFRNPDSLKPFRTFLDPLLTWFDVLHTAPHKVIPEDTGKYNCLTPQRIELKTRPPVATSKTDALSSGTAMDRQEQSVPGTVPAPTPAHEPYLMRIQDETFARAEVQQTCVVVYKSGSYHMEKSSQRMREQVRSQVYEGTVPDSSLESLRQMLDDPQLKGLEHGNLPEGTTFSSAGVVLLWVPREKSVQHLGFATDLRVQAAIGSHVISNDPNARLIRPLQRWAKSEAPGNKDSLVENAPANLCVPR